ncbi:hypothetical protein MCETRH20_01089 [Methylophilaceae bacterium]
MKAKRHLLFILLLGTALIGSAHASGNGQTDVKPPPPKDLPPPPPAPEGKTSKPKAAVKASPFITPVNVVIENSVNGSLCKLRCS